jgi:DNA-binding PadR family transcriptional regulator
VNDVTIQESNNVLAVRRNIEAIVLNELHDSPKHGYQIIQNIRKRHGAYMGASTVYPLLFKFEEEGYIVGEWKIAERRCMTKKTERSKKIYTLTNKGLGFLQSLSTEIFLATNSLFKQQIIIPDGCDASPFCATCKVPCTETEIETARKVGQIREILIARAQKRKNPDWKNDL